MARISVLFLSSALLYTGVGWLTLTGSAFPYVPPNFNAAAGFSLAVIILAGERFALSIWLGAFLLYLTGVAGSIPPGLAAVLALGPALQAWLGWRLLHYLVRPLPPTSVAGIIRMIGLSLPIALIGPLLGGLGLTLNGTIATPDLPSYIWFWWIANYAGLLFVTPPLVTLWLLWRRQHPPEPLDWPVASMLVGLAIPGNLFSWPASLATELRILMGVIASVLFLIYLYNRHQIEARLRTSEQRSQLLLQAIPDLVLRFTRQGHILDYAAGEGWSLAEQESSLIGRSLEQILPADIVQRLLAGSALALEQHRPQVVEYQLPAANGQRSFEARLVIDAANQAVVAFIRDVSEERAAAAALRQSQAQYELVAKHAADVIWVLDPLTQHFTYVSPSVERLRGYSPTEVMNQSMADTMTSESLARVTALLQQYPIAPGLPPVTVELDQICKDGSIVTTEVTSSYVLNEHGQLQVIGVSRNISERKQAEFRLQRLTRTYRVLSAVNAMIVRERNQRRLLEQACQILVEQGGLHMAWVGLFDPATRRVEPIASAGITGDYLAQLEINLDDPARGRGPTGTAIRTGSPVVINAITTDPRMAPWRANALAQGYQASVSFPLVVAGSIRGVINLYARDPEFFDQEEVRLLDDLASDIAFAMAFNDQEQQRRQIERQLRTNQRRNQALLQAIPDLMVRISRDGTILDYVPPENWVMEISLDERVGQSMHKILPPPVGEAFARAIEQAITSGTLETIEFELDAPGSTNRYYFEARISASPDSEEAVLIVRDMSERKQMQQALEERLKEMTCLRQVQQLVERNLSPNEVAPEVLTYMQAAMRFPDVALVQLWLDDLRYGPDVMTIPATQQLMALIYASGTTIGQIKVAYQKPHPFILPEEQHLLDGVATTLGLWIERRYAESALLEERNSLKRRIDEHTADLSRANYELARAIRTKDDFLANMSHELRTPLNAILALSESLSEQLRGPLNQRQLDALNNIDSSARHLLSLINDILDLSKIEAGRLELQSELVAVGDLCNACLVFVKEQALKKQIQLSFQLNDQLAIIEADPRRLKQILVNLLTNAVKFTPKGGAVKLEVVLDPISEQARFTVRDTGIGISPEDLRHLFQPFVQADASLNRSHEGTGLGLALVQRLTDLHGGSVTVESTIGVGSCFMITLPYQPEPTSSPELSDGAPPLTLRLALVIEDSVTASEQIARYLSELKITPVVHPYGHGATSQAAALQPDVILLDLQMPDQSGWQVLAELKANPKLASIPVVIISVVDERARGRAAGAADYLVKPITREMLQHAIRQVAEKVAQAKQLTNPVVLPTPALNGIRVLLVEDNELNIIAIGDYLRDHGYSLALARNGQEALDQAEQVQPDLILMDIQMPVMDGLEATRRLRNLPALAQIPIIALTALAMPGDRERCLAAGASAYLTKPVSLKELRELMTTMLTGKMA
ncbi:MAG: response regulator [Oscillochloridaceae bacterium umkhey_bin13]